MRFDGAREGLDPNQISIVDEEFRWVDENGKEHRSPMTEDIQRAITSSGAVTSRTIDGFTGDANFSAAHIYDYSSSETLYLDEITVVSLPGIEASTGYSISSSEGISIYNDEDGINHVETVIVGDGETTYIDTPQQSFDLNGIYFIGISGDDLHYSFDLSIEGD